MEVWYKELNELNAKYVLIEGTGTERHERAVEAVDEYLKKL